MYCVGPIQKPRCSPFRPSRFDSVGMAGDTFATSRRGMKAAEGYIGGPEVKSTSFLPARRRSGGRTRGRGGILREPSHRITVVLESFCAFERILRGVHHEVVLVVVAPSWRIIGGRCWPIRGAPIAPSCTICAALARSGARPRPVCAIRDKGVGFALMNPGIAPRARGRVRSALHPADQHP